MITSKSPENSYRHRHCLGDAGELVEGQGENCDASFEGAASDSIKRVWETKLVEADMKTMTRLISSASFSRSISIAILALLF
jgi:hypothetical protein